MEAPTELQRVSLVPLFKLKDETHMAKMKVEETLEVFGAVVIAPERESV